MMNNALSNNPSLSVMRGHSGPFSPKPAHLHFWLAAISCFSVELHLGLGGNRCCLNNRFDLEGVFALIKCCDAVITVDNAVAHFAAALGVPVAVLVPAAQTQYRWKNQSIQRLLFPSARLFIQSKPGDWSGSVEAAWRYAFETTDVKPSRS